MIHSAIRGYIAGFALIACLPAMAQEGDFSVWERDLFAESVIVLAPGLAGDSDIGPSDPVLFEVSIAGSAERILESGARIGARGAFRVQKDHGARPGFAGNLPSGDMEGPRGAFSGLAPGPVPRESGPRGSLESAHVYLAGGYGELTAGRDRGVAARFHEGDVGVFTHASASNPYLDASGLNLVRTRHDLTGPSAKLSYTTPRLIGLKAGVSFTPRARAHGLDRNLRFSGGGISGPELDNAIEFGLNASRRLQGSGVRLRAGLGYSTAELDAAPDMTTVSGRVETYSIGGEAEFGDWRLGANALHSDDGLAAGNYASWSAGASRKVGEWAWSVTYGRAEADAVASEAESFSFGTARALNDKLRFAAGYQVNEIDMAGLGDGSGRGFDGTQRGFVVEITLTP